MSSVVQTQRLVAAGSSIGLAAAVWDSLGVRATDRAGPSTPVAWSAVGARSVHGDATGAHAQPSQDVGDEASIAGIGLAPTKPLNLCNAVNEALHMALETDDR